MWPKHEREARSLEEIFEALDRFGLEWVKWPECYCGGTEYDECAGNNYDPDVVLKPRFQEKVRRICELGKVPCLECAKVGRFEGDGGCNH